MAKDLKNKPKLTSKIPLVSVVMSVYNGEKYLREAIDSILNQTFTDFEFIIINDGSTDNTLKIIKSYKDPRIVLISRKNKGLVASLNEGIGKAKGKYIARMDADDVSLPERFEKQVEYMIQHPGVGLIGSQVALIGENGEIVNPLISRPIKDQHIKLLNGYGTVITHVAALFKKDLFMEVGGYNEKYYLAEDHDLWCRMAEVTTMHNLPSIYVRIRTLEEGVSISGETRQSLIMRQISMEWRKKHKKYSIMVFNPIYNLIISKSRRDNVGYSISPFVIAFIDYVRDDINKSGIPCFFRKILILILKINQFIMRKYES